MCKRAQGLWSAKQLTHIVTFLSQIQKVLHLKLQELQCTFWYFCFAFDHLWFEISHFPQKTGCNTRTWLPPVFILCWGMTDGTTIPLPLLSKLLSIIPLPSSLQKFNCGSAGSFLAHAQELIVFLVAMAKRKVNCWLGQHFVLQVWSNPIESWQWLLWSSTKCFAW